MFNCAICGDEFDDDELMLGEEGDDLCLNCFEEEQGEEIFTCENCGQVMDTNYDTTCENCREEEDDLEEAREMILSAMSILDRYNEDIMGNIEDIYTEIFNKRK
jgi:hypothetical protein